MHKITFNFAAGLLALLMLSGCGNDQQKQAEVVRDFEENFGLQTMQDSASEQISSRYSEAGIGPRQADSIADPSSAGEGSEATGGAPFDQGASNAGLEISPAIREAAQEVVQHMKAGQYSSAVVLLDRLMGEPGLTPNQWIAARNAMAEVQQRIVMDPAISDAAKEKARDVLRRQ